MEFEPLRLVWAVVIGPRANRRVHALYETEQLAQIAADAHNAHRHKSSTPASVEAMPVAREA